jgi:hypothetical protein
MAAVAICSNLLVGYGMRSAAAGCVRLLVLPLVSMHRLSETDQVLWRHEDQASTRAVNVRDEKESDA